MIEVRIIVTHCTTKYAAYDIAGAGIGWQLAIGNGESYGTNMIGQDTECNVLFAVGIGIFFTGHVLYVSNSAGKQIGIIVALFALQYPHQALKAHACIHMLCRQRDKCAVFLAVVLHEYVIPYLYNLRMICVYQFAAGHLFFLFVGSAIHMYL